MATLTERILQLQYQMNGGDSFAPPVKRAPAAKVPEPAPKQETAPKPVVAEEPEQKPRETVRTGFPVNLTTEQLVQGIILAEVLDKPVSKRRGRR